MNILVVGVGSIGKRHLRNLLRLKYNERSINVVDPNEEARAGIKEEFGIKGYPSLDLAFEESRFEVALVCSPNHLHIPQARILLNHGCSLFIEKPLTTDLGQVGELIRQAEKNKALFMVGCNLRFHPGVKTLKKVLRDSLLGRPLYCRAVFAHYLPNWRPGQDYRKTYSAQKLQGGGILLDAIHEPDYLCWLFGKVSKVRAHLATIGDLEIDVEDYADYLMWHQKDFCSNVHVDYLRRDKIRSCEIVGTAGTVTWESVGKKPEQVTVRHFDAEAGRTTDLYVNELYDLNQQYVDEIKYFLRCVSEGINPMNGLREALHTLQVIDEVRFSSESGEIQNLSHEDNNAE